MSIKNDVGRPMGTTKNKFPSTARTLFNSLIANKSPSGLSGSPYLPKPTCSTVCMHESEWIELSVKCN